MGIGVWDFLSPALMRVRQNSEYVLRFRKGRVSDYLPINLESLPLRFLSALVLVGASYYGGKRIEGSGLVGWTRGNGLMPGISGAGTVGREKLWTEQVIGMAAILQLMQMAADIHNQIGDVEGNAVLSTAFEEQTPHFPVLFGDFVYGKLLKLLCEIDCYEWVEELAKIICTMNEGAIIRKEVLEVNHQDLEAALIVLEKEYGALFDEAGRTGVILAGGTAAEAKQLGQFGGLIGMLIGANELQLDSQISESLRREAQKTLNFLPEGWLRDAGQEFLREIGAGIAGIPSLSGMGQEPRLAACSA